MNVAFLIGSVHALFFSILVFNKKGKTIADKVLGIWLLLFSVHLIFPYLYYGDNYRKYIHIGGVDTPLVMLHAGFLIIYAKALITKVNEFDRKWLYYFLPFVGLTISMTPFYMISTSDKIAMYENRMELPKFVYIYPVISVVLLNVFIIITLKFLKRHRVNIKKEYSYESEIDLTWLRILIYSIIFFTSLILIYSIGVAFRIISFNLGDIIIYLFLVLVVFIGSFFGYKQKQIFIYPPNEEDTSKSKMVKPHQQSSNKEITKHISSSDKEFIKQLEEYMLSQKPYLNSKLNLYDLATQLNVSSSYLSWCLNNCLQTNFYQFVNKFRVTDFQNRIHKKENKDYTLHSIAINSGFNSKATFNRIFKETTGITPSEYIKSL